MPFFSVLISLKLLLLSIFANLGSHRPPPASHISLPFSKNQTHRKVSDRCRDVEFVWVELDFWLHSSHVSFEVHLFPRTVCWPSPTVEGWWIHWQCYPNGAHKEHCISQLFFGRCLYLNDWFTFLSLKKIEGDFLQFQILEANLIQSLMAPQPSEVFKQGFLFPEVL